MAEFQLVMPKMGESIAEATIIRWLKNEGESIEVDEALLEIATDKVDSEVPTPKSGLLIKKLFKDGDVVKIGEAVAIIETEGEMPNIPLVNNASASSVIIPTSESKPVNEVAADNLLSQGSHKFYSPLVLNIAREEGIDMLELEKIPGTGKEERVTKRDILEYIENRGAKPEASESPIISSTPVSSPIPSIPDAPKSKPSNLALQSGDEILEMDRMRKLIADHMVMSVSTSPHVTSFVEADVTNLVNWRNKMKDVFKKREGENLTFTPLFVEAIVKAIKDFPMINVSLDGDKIIKRKNINIGMAAALPTGNLIVPVIKNADTMNLIGLAKSVNDLANRARLNKLAPDDIQGGTYTVTNVGTFGNIMGTPIINQPQVAIMAMGSITKKPAVLETEYGDVIAIRHMMYLSHSYDHRVVDGVLGGNFVRRVADYLENWDVNREI
jgi:2-oxoglutarate dehydrogenase E2 component (dihydrolipoamide succinyltransferase)